MNRRASLPGAAELFRPTAPATPNGSGDEPPTERLDPPNGSPTRRGSGRQKHDAKITVYVSADELVALEQARLALRATHGVTADRGRVVREAIAALLADFDAHGEESLLVRRLSRERAR